MKTLVLAAALSSATLPVYAGTSEAPQMDITVITQSAATADAQQWIVPAVFSVFFCLSVAAQGHQYK